MQIQSGKDAARRLGEYVLTIIAASHQMQALHLGMSDLPGGDIPAWALPDVLGAGTRLPRMNVFRMPGGDLFMFAEKFPGDVLRQLRALLAGRVAGMEPDDLSAVCHIYDVPDDAVPLRRLVKSYVAGAQRPPHPASTAMPFDAPPPSADPGTSASAAAAATGPGLDGPLTPERLRELQRLVDRIEITPFIRQQAIWRKGERWAADYVEYFFDIDRLRQCHFPNLDLAANEGLLLEFCRDLDDLMLIHLLTDKTVKPNRIGINLSIATIDSPAFQKFSDRLTGRQRRNVVCELHWLEILQDLQGGGRTVGCLVDSGFSIAMDRIGVPVLPYLNLAGSKFDYVKVRFDRRSLAQIDPERLAALRRCPPENVVLTACDNRRAVALGEKLRIGTFQGRLLDEMMTRAA